jgi:predicted dehydrogenase
MKFQIGIIGCGLIGKKRLMNLGKYGRVTSLCDKKLYKAKKLSKNIKYKLDLYTNWKSLIDKSSSEIIIISTIHSELSKILIYCIKKNKHVLVEKPGAINPKELLIAQNLLRKKNLVVHVGYNHRFHSSILKALEILKRNVIGELMYIKSSYGHGGRLNYEKEWRMKPKISGGGELIDQGSHIIDLSNLFLGDPIKFNSKLTTSFWKTSVDDNAFLILTYKKNKIAFLHASCSEWKNYFEFQIYGKKGKIFISGKGGSYGEEKLILYKMKKKMGMPSIKKYIFNEKKNNSWENEMNNFYSRIIKKEYSNNLETSYKNLKLIKKIYRSNNYDNCS